MTSNRQTASLICLSSMATRRLLGELSRLYERETAITVSIVSIGGVEAARRVRSGEAVDVIVLAEEVMTALHTEARILGDGVVGVARSSVAVAVAAGAPLLDIGDEAAVRQAVLGARAISFSTGPSGDHLKRLWRRWGVEAAVAAKAVQPPPGTPVAAVIARGDADLGFQQLSELLGAPGIEVLGLLPPDIQQLTTFAAGVSATSRQPAVAAAFIAYLTSPDAAAAKHAYGMEPTIERMAEAWRSAAS